MKIYFQVIIFVLFLGSPSLSPAAIYIVNSLSDGVDANVGSDGCRTFKGVCTLRAAVMESNNTPSTTDTIVLTGGSTYYLGYPGVGGAELGDLDITSSVAVTATSEATIHAGKNSDRIFDVTGTRVC